MHSRSVYATRGCNRNPVGGRDSNSLCPHTVRSWQTRSDVRDGTLTSNCPSAQRRRCVEQPRSDDSVGARDAHSSGAHAVTGAQGRPSSAPDHVAFKVHGAHTRSDSGVPGEAWPDPAAHVRQLLHASADVLPADANRPASHALHVALPAAA